MRTGDRVLCVSVARYGTVVAVYPSWEGAHVSVDGALHWVSKKDLRTVKR